MGKELLYKAFRCQPADTIPWVPFVGCHGGSLTRRPADEFLKSDSLIYEGMARAIELYQPDGIPVLFDLQLEAEVLGCSLKWNKKTPPSVISHPLTEGKKLDKMTVPGPGDGRIPLVMRAAAKLVDTFPQTGIYGLVTGPFTLALHLAGTDIFLKMLEDQDEMKDLMEFCTRVSETMAGYYIDSGCDIIALVDPMTSQIDPLLFEEFVSPGAEKIFTFIRKREKLSSFFVCGHAQQNIEAMCLCRPDNISIDENIPLQYVREAAGNHGISFGGNLKLTVVLLHGTETDCQREALECMEIGGNKGFVLSPGCDLPYDTPPRNLQAISSLVKDSYLREVTRVTGKAPADVEHLNMKDYGLADKVIVDIITLDSESCAPCQYMVEAVKKVAPHFEGIVEWREHPIKKLEGISFMSSLMVKNIPTICIDGKISFVSRIPPQHELILAIQKRINEKLRLKIRSKKGEILVLGHNEEEIAGLVSRIKTAVEETGKDIPIKTSLSREVIDSYGILLTPAVVITEYKLKSEGEYPSTEVIKEWIKSI